MSKKIYLLFSTGILSILVACTSVEDRGMGQGEERLKVRDEITGCSFIDANGKVRDCIEKTYKNKKPSSYTTGVLEDGQPVAVLNQKEKETIQVFAPLTEKESTAIYVNESGNKQNLVKNVKKETIITEVIKEKTPQEQASLTVAEVSSSGKVQETDEIFILKEEQPSQATLPSTQPSKALEKVSSKEPSSVLFTNSETLPEEQTLLEKESKSVSEVKPDQKWWDNYETETETKSKTTKDKLKDLTTEPVCPCPDPNIPCPECFEK